VKTVTHLLVHLVGAREPDLMLKLMNQHFWIDGACGPHLAREPPLLTTA